jgi:hypothetical protein
VAAVFRCWRLPLAFLREGSGTPKLMVTHHRMEAEIEPTVRLGGPGAREGRRVSTSRKGVRALDGFVRPDTAVPRVAVDAFESTYELHQRNPHELVCLSH